jgi:lipopolysaccharide assembly protein B
MLPDLSIALVVALFVAVAAGWLAGRFLYWKAGRAHNPSNVPTEYFQGLNFVLNEEPDKALEVFLKMVEVDNETVETHFALGSLYRRRGEVDRAIRVHENIIARPSLSPEHREHGVFALAEDYFRAGLFDRAEQLFQELAEHSTRRVGALRFLLHIYEQQRDWEFAVETFSRLAALASPEYPTALAHYYCELADRARAAREYETARELLHRVREVQRNFPRGALVRADVALEMGDPQLAAALCRRVVELHPHLLALVLPRFVRTLRAQSPGEGQSAEAEASNLQSLSTWVRSEPGARAEFAYAAIVAGQEDDSFVLECLRDFVRADPNLGDLVPAMLGDLSRLDEPALQQLARSLGRIFRRTQRYRCVECGVSSASHFWQCPGCRSWDSMAPVARLDLAPTGRAR